MRIFDGNANAGHSSEMDDAGGRILLEDCGEQSPIAHVTFDKQCLTLRNAGRGIVPILSFAGRAIVVVEIVQSNDLMAMGQKSLGNVTAYESSGAGKQDNTIHNWAP